MTSIRAAVIAAAVLVLEYLVVSFSFDAIPAAPGLSWLAGRLGFLVPAVVTIASAAYVLARPVSVEHGDDAAILRAPTRPPLLISAAHACLFAAFLWATRQFVGTRTDNALYDLALFAAWGVLGAATVVSLAATAFEPQWLFGLIRRKRALLIAATATGAVAFCAGRAAEHLWAPLGSWTLSCVAFVLRPFLAGLIVQPERLIVGTRQFLVEIAPVCSGLEGVGLISAFVTLYLVTARDQIVMPRALVLFPIGIAAAWSANVFRIAGLVWVGSRWSASLAAGGLHSKTGWLLFCALAVGLVFFANRTAFIRGGDAAEPTSNPAAGYLLPFVALAATTFLVAIPSGNHDEVRALRLIAVALALWFSRASRPALRFLPSWHAAAIGAVAFVLTTILERLPAIAPTATSFAGALPPAGAVVWVVEAVTAVVAIPIACELAFRGYLLRRIASRSFADVGPRQAGWVALLIAGAAYAAASGSFWTALPAGVLYGLAYRHRERLGDAVLAHAAASALSLTLAPFLAR